jgi:hypothetical protein
MRSLLILAMFWALSAEAVQVSRITEFEDGTRIRADEVNDEFDNIISAINTNDSELIGTSKIDPYSGAYILNRRIGCILEGSHTGGYGNRGFNVTTPCELVINGYRAALETTQNLSVLANIDTGSPGQATWHSVYARIASENIVFHTSLTAPDVTTGKKAGDATARYLGAVRTAAATDDVVMFKTSSVGNEYTLYSTSAVSYTHPTVVLTTTATADHITDGPLWGKETLFQPVAVGSGTGMCAATFYSDLNYSFPIISTITGTYAPMKQPYFTRQLVNFSFSTSNNCTGMSLKETGFADHPHLYR